MDVIDEQLDVIGRGLLGQTITCARCHDHKFDPIPTRDYYALAGILKNAKALQHENVSKWLEVPLPLPADEDVRYRRHEEATAALQGRLDLARAALKKATGKTVAGTDAGIVSVRELAGIVIDDQAARRVGEWQHSQSVKSYVGDGYLHDLDADKGAKTLTFVAELPATGLYEVRLAYTPGENRAVNAPVMVFSAEGEKSIVVNQREAPPLDGRFISLGRYRFERGGQSFVIVSNAGTRGHVVADAVQFLAVAAVDSPAASGKSVAADAKTVEPDEVLRLRGEVKRLEGELRSLQSEGPQRPMVMTVIEQGDPKDLAIHVRGSVHTLGPVVPRGFLQVATGPEQPAIPADSGGRRELADWIASPGNPLTARVLVNRVWHWLFGAGLVRTTDNFGTTGEAPSHPELLDDLATKFIEEGWSVKRLIRRIVLSRTYRLSTADDAEGRVIDPENRLLWHRTRRRLDAECLRDAMLQTAGELQQERGGAGFPERLVADYGYVAVSRRRSIYLPVFRNALPDLFEVFDFADPSLVTGQRNASTVAPQALFLLNHPFVIEQSRLAAVRLLRESPAGNEGRLNHVWRTIVGRKPDIAERHAALEFLASRPAGPAEDEAAAWAEIVQALFASLSFRNVE